jgi:hypothetical protein
LLASDVVRFATELFAEPASGPQVVEPAVDVA